MQSEQHQALYLGKSDQGCLPFGQYAQSGGVLCVYCGMDSPVGMEQHVESKALLNCCPLCHCCRHLDVAGDNKAGVMIWLPEISQGQLNSTVTIIFALVGLSKVGDEIDAATAERLRTFYSILESRTQPIEVFFNGKNEIFDASSPLWIAQQIRHSSLALLNKDVKTGNGGTVKLTRQELEFRQGGLRFLAHPQPFQKYIRGVAKRIVASGLAKQWATMLSEEADALGRAFSADAEASEYEEVA